MDHLHLVKIETAARKELNSLRNFLVLQVTFALYHAILGLQLSIRSFSSKMDHRSKFFVDYAPANSNLSLDDTVVPFGNVRFKNVRLSDLHFSSYIALK